jgi:hypothetical protein
MSLAWRRLCTQVLASHRREPAARFEGAAPNMENRVSELLKSIKLGSIAFGALR